MKGPIWTKDCGCVEDIWGKKVKWCQRHGRQVRVAYVVGWLLISVAIVLMMWTIINP